MTRAGVGVVVAPERVAALPPPPQPLRRHKPQQESASQKYFLFIFSSRNRAMRYDSGTTLRYTGHKFNGIGVTCE